MIWSLNRKDFLPYTLNINIPNQTYFYELYQMINLKTIKTIRCCGGTGSASEECFL